VAGILGFYYISLTFKIVFLLNEGFLILVQVIIGTLWNFEIVIDLLKLLSGERVSRGD